MKTERAALSVALMVGVFLSMASAEPRVLSLNASRTGNAGLYTGADRYLTSPSMTDATAVLQTAGFTINTTSAFTAANITGYCTLYTGAVNVAFSAQEIADVKAYVAAGHGLVIQRDWDGFYPEAEPLAAAFGATYDPGPYGISNTPTAVNMTLAHAIWNGPAGSVTTYDQVYSSSVSGATGIGVHSTSPSQVALAVTNYGAGRVVFLTDMGAWDCTYTGDTVSPVAGSNNAIVWENIFWWACRGSPNPPVPAPGTLLLVGIGTPIVAWLRRRRVL